MGEGGGIIGVLTKLKGKLGSQFDAPKFGTFAEVWLRLCVDCVFVGRKKTSNRKTLTAPRQQNRGPRTECSVWTRTLKIMAGKEILPRAGFNFPALSARGVTNIPARVQILWCEGVA